MAIMQVTQLLTKITGQFGVAISLLRTTQSVGAVLSNLITEYIVLLTGNYQVGFGMLGAAGLISVIFVQLMKVSPLILTTTDDTFE